MRGNSNVGDDVLFFDCTLTVYNNTILNDIDSFRVAYTQ